MYSLIINIFLSLYRFTSFPLLSLSSPIPVEGGGEWLCGVWLMAGVKLRQVQRVEITDLTKDGLEKSFYKFIILV